MFPDTYVRENDASSDVDNMHGVPILVVEDERKLAEVLESALRHRRVQEDRRAN